LFGSKAVRFHELAGLCFGANKKLKSPFAFVFGMDFFSMQKVTFRDDANDIVVLRNHRNSTNTFGNEQAGDVMDRGIGGNRHNVPGHYVLGFHGTLLNVACGAACILPLGAKLGIDPDQVHCCEGLEADRLIMPLHLMIHRWKIL